MCNGTVKDFDPPISRGKVADAVDACTALGREECYAVLDVTGDGMDLKRCIATHNANEQRNSLLAPSATSDVCFYVPADETCGNSYHGSCKDGMKASPDTPCTPLPPPGAPNLCPPGKEKFARSEKDTTECLPGYEHITTVEDCVAGAQAVAAGEGSPQQPIPSDTDGDGQSVPLSDTEKMEAWMQKRVISSTNPLGARKPPGCYEDSSIRIVDEKQELITTFWINENKTGHKHDNSAPICKLICDLPPPLPSVPCNENICCMGASLNMCDPGKVNCTSGTKFKSASTMCPADGCTPFECCEPMTCGSDFKDFCDDWYIALPGDTKCNGDCSKETCCRRGTPPTTASPPCTKGLTTSPPPCDPTKEKFAKSDKDTTDCLHGYEHITTVEDCVAGAQAVGDDPSDTNGDGEKVLSRPVTPENTAALTAWIQKRVIASNDPLGAHKPFGCFEDQSLRIVSAGQELVTTFWVNYNKASSRRHDNSAPICKLICDSHAPAQKLYNAEEGKHLRKHAASGYMSHPLAITCVALAMLVTTFAFVSVKRRSCFVRSSYVVAGDTSDEDLNQDILHRGTWKPIARLSQEDANDDYDQQDAASDCTSRMPLVQPD